MDLAAIRAKVKELIGDLSFDDTVLDPIINRKYQRDLPLEFTLEALKSEYSVATQEGVDTYAVDPDIYLTIKAPAYIDGAPISFWIDKVRFYTSFGRERVHPITAVDTSAETIGIGGDYTTAFHAAQTFRVSGSTGNDGNWVVSTSSYTSPTTTITVTGNLTDATVDGNVILQDRAQPSDILYWAQDLIFRSVPDSNSGGNYILTTDTILVPTALAGTTDEPIEKQWGLLIAIDTAIEVMIGTQRTEEVAGLATMRQYASSLVSGKEERVYSNTRAKPSV